MQNGSSDCSYEQIDVACLSITSLTKNVLTLYTRSSECDECDFVEVRCVPPNGLISVPVDTTFPIDLYVSQESSTCNKTYSFKEHGVYGWNISSDFCSDIYTLKKPDNPYISLYATFLLFLAILVVKASARYMYDSQWFSRRFSTNTVLSQLENDLGTPEPSDEGAMLVRSELQSVRRQQIRVHSVDTFRGICIALMIFVNYGGGHYWFFKHSPWNGLTFADLVFPWFLWIMGVSMAICLRSQLRSSVQRRQLFFKVCTRSLTLLVLGLILNTNKGPKGNDLKTLRYCGVLQRIGISYFVIAALETALMKRQVFCEYGPWLLLQDVLDSWLQWLLVLTLAVSHAVVSLLLPVPGCPLGYLGPGGLHNHSMATNCTGGAAGYLDRMLLGENHMYQTPSCKHVYDTHVPYDPEGVLGILTSIMLVYFGVQAGRILLCYQNSFSRLTRWIAWAITMGLLAGVLCGFSKNKGLIPVNKNLWSLSFVLATGCMAFLVQSILYIIIDNRQWWTGAPFTCAGRNAILLYIGHELTKKMFPWSWDPYYRTHTEFLLMNLWGTALWIVTAHILGKKSIFLTV